MKHFTCLVFIAAMAIAITAISACKKSNENDYATDPPMALLYGKWELKKSYISTGGYPEPHDEPAGKYLQLNADGSVKGTAMPTTTHFTVKDSVTIDFTYQSPDNGTQVITYRYKVGTNKLSLSGPCIEGCSALYEKVR